MGVGRVAVAGQSLAGVPVAGQTALVQAELDRRVQLGHKQGGGSGFWFRTGSQNLSEAAYLLQQLLGHPEVVPGLLIGRLVRAAALEEDGSQVVVHLEHRGQRSGFTRFLQTILQELGDIMNT